MARVRKIRATIHGHDKGIRVTMLDSETPACSARERISRNFISDLVPFCLRGVRTLIWTDHGNIGLIQRGIVFLRVSDFFFLNLLNFASYP